MMEESNDHRSDGFTGVRSRRVNMDKTEPIDVLVVGEIVVDFISAERTDSLDNAATFRRGLGGSPANIAAGISKLGGSSAVVSKTGIGSFGKFLKGELQRHGVSTDYLVMDHRTNTTIIFIARTAGSPDFEDFRSGDYLLTPSEVSEEAVERARVVHASTFALSREPCRSAVGKAFRMARERGKIVSLDPNYSMRVWPNHKEAMEVLRRMFRYVDITKPSLDDAGRIFGWGHTPEQYIEMFHELGPETVVLTMGDDGVLVSEDGRLTGSIPAREVVVEDTTGAGDAFWAGFLVALLDAHPPARCALFAREIVETKLAHTGPIFAETNRANIYSLIEAMPDGAPAAPVEEEEAGEDGEPRAGEMS